MDTRKVRALMSLGVWACMAIAVAAQEPVTLSIVPYGGTTMAQGQTIAVEVFISANETVLVGGGQVDVPSSFSPQPGSSGMLTILPGPAGGTVDPDGDGTEGPSGGGVPYLFGPAGDWTYNSSLNIISGQASPQEYNVFLLAGLPRYIGTMYFEADACAEGNFVINFECTDQAMGQCDNVPEPTNTTHFYMDPPGPEVVLYSLEFVGSTITVLPVPFGDLFPIGGNGVIDVDDVLCGLGGFVNAADCPQADIVDPEGGCTPDGIIDVTDLLHLLAAFIGYSSCPGPCG